MGRHSHPAVQLEEGLAWVPRVGLQSFVRWQVRKFVSPGQVPGAGGKGSSAGVSSVVPSCNPPLAFSPPRCGIGLYDLPNPLPALGL